MTRDLLGLVLVFLTTATTTPDMLPKCAICGQPIPLEAAKVSEDGKAVHEECYVAKIKGEKPQQPKH